MLDLKIRGNTGIALAISACALYGIATYFFVPLGGDALMEYDIIYFIANHEIKHGEPAFWNPYLYVGQQVQPGFHVHYVFSADALIAKFFSILPFAPPFAVIYSAARLAEALFLYGACLLIGRELKLSELASALGFLVILLSFPLITQSWPFDIVLFSLWTVYFILRCYRSPSWLNVSFLAASAVSLLMGAKIIGFVMMEIPLFIIGAGLLAKATFLKRSIPIALLFAIFAFVVHNNFQLYEEDNFYGGRASGGYLSSNDTDQGQGEADARIRDYQSTLNFKTLTNSTLNPLTIGNDKNQSYVASDIGGYFGFAFILLAIFSIASFDYRDRRQQLLLAAAAPLFLFAVYPSILLWIPDSAAKIINFRYYNFALGPLKVALLFLGLLIASNTIFRNENNNHKKIAVVTLLVVGILMLFGLWPLAFATLIIAAALYLWVPASVRIYVILCLAIFELVYAYIVAIGVSGADDKIMHPINKAVSLREKNSYSFEDLRFHLYRQNNPLGERKYPNQLPAHQRDIPLPIMEGNLVGGWNTGSMSRCLKSEVDEFREKGSETSSLLDWVGVTRPVFRWLDENDEYECIRSSETAEETYQCGADFHLTVRRYTANAQSYTIDSNRPGEIIYSMHDDSLWRVRINDNEYDNEHSCFFTFPVEKGLTRIDMKYQNTMLEILHYSGLITFGWLLFGAAFSLNKTFRVFESTGRVKNSFE